MINKLPFIGWFFSFFGNVSLSVPFWLCWTVFGIGQRYFSFVPPVYQSISFWNCVGLFIVLSILRGLLPTVVSIQQTNTMNNKPPKEDASAGV